MEGASDGEASSSGAEAAAVAGPPTCRLCWEAEGAPPSGLLLSPCRCKGSCAHIHVACLQRWLNTRPGRGVCDICRAQYDGPLLADVGVRIPPPPPAPPAAALDGQRLRVVWWSQLAAPQVGPLLGMTGRLMPQHNGAAAAHGTMAAARPRRGPRRPRWWRRDPAADARFWSGLLHGAWRAAVAADGIAATLSLLRHRRAPRAAGVLPWPVAAARRGAARRAVSGPLTTAEEVRASFDGTTIWQVQVYCAIVALAPSRPVSEACSGMALGAIIGGCLSSLAFLPLVGIPRLNAIAGAALLAARAGARLAAGLACRPAGHRRLARALGAAAAPVGWARQGLAGLARRVSGQRGGGAAAGRQQRRLQPLH
ncbi:hypothetical protein Rsub_00608 [Raphidocelis subcapitata]|uniref:RING-CH-type domain-containing protein n=1 Tax=Raphidocelis subcapitata TaxID=307507 RepID=A0A2V0NKN3_9CHLO|nr:hypothetical protein Rsub_00608 [Raphidocelis subcapitata]|eukprot:GBF87896.1 hypothetical protein Rsub_00608 [Raphidocelis subcapitata]